MQMTFDTRVKIALMTLRLFKKYRKTSLKKCNNFLEKFIKELSTEFGQN